MNLTIELPAIRFDNLHLANGKAVAFPAVTGVHCGRGFSKFNLKSLGCGQLGNDAFTEVYFTTESGNVYRISQPKTAFDRYEQYWHLISLNHQSSGNYRLDADEMVNGELELEVGRPFRYGPGWSSKVKAILCVNARRSCARVHAEFVSDLRNEFIRRLVV